MQYLSLALIYISDNVGVAGVIYLTFVVFPFAAALTGAASFAPPNVIFMSSLTRGSGGIVMV